LVPGDIVRVRTGDIIPADVKLLTGELTVDQSALAGESKDADMKPGDVVPSGSVVRKTGVNWCPCRFPLVAAKLVRVGSSPSPIERPGRSYSARRFPSADRVLVALRARSVQSIPTHFPSCRCENHE